MLNIRVTESVSGRVLWRARVLSLTHAVKKRFSNTGWAITIWEQYRQNKQTQSAPVRTDIAWLLPESCGLHHPYLPPCTDTPLHTAVSCHTQNTKICKHSCLILKHKEENVYNTHYFVLHIVACFFFFLEMSMWLPYFVLDLYFLLYIFINFSCLLKRRKWPKVSL